MCLPPVGGGALPVLWRHMDKVNRFIHVYKQITWRLVGKKSWQSALTVSSQWKVDSTETIHVHISPCKCSVLTSSYCDVTMNGHIVSYRKSLTFNKKMSLLMCCTDMKFCKLNLGVKYLDNFRCKIHVSYANVSLLHANLPLSFALLLQYVWTDIIQAMLYSVLELRAAESCIQSF